MSNIRKCQDKEKEKYFCWRDKNSHIAEHLLAFSRPVEEWFTGIFDFVQCRYFASILEPNRPSDTFIETLEGWNKCHAMLGDDFRSFRKYAFHLYLISPKSTCCVDSEIAGKSSFSDLSTSDITSRWTLRYFSSSFTGTVNWNDAVTGLWSENKTSGCEE